MFDCSKIRQLGIDRKENFRAGAIMIHCGQAKGGDPETGLANSSAFSKLVQNLTAPLVFGGTDVDLVTGTESFPNVTQSETYTAANPDDPNQIVVAYNDSRGVNASPINISAASVSTDGGTTFTRVTNAGGQSPFPDTFGDPVVLYNKPTGLGLPCGWMATAALRASAGISPPLPRTRIAGHIFAFTRAAATIANLAGLTTTQPRHSLGACIFPGGFN